MLARVWFVFLTIFWLAASGAAMAQTNCLDISGTIPCIDKNNPMSSTGPAVSSDFAPNTPPYRPANSRTSSLTTPSSPSSAPVL